MYFYGRDGMSFYCNAGSFFKAVFYVFLPEAPITCPVEEIQQSEGCLTFALCGLLLFYLLMSVCCQFFWTLLFHTMSH